ncbi:hypothetical protein [Neobacillus niacini]|uniref:hypothetical protein n=1 Tax=Neobacillus niacini TaxID=86668 RepID=UPI0021CB475B|nr:hypothetical protein [Neobacillus niacini]MCM3766425.1 hypothetical protein [Neobacillus niacini]
MSKKMKIRDIRSKNGPEVRMRVHHFANPEERQQILMDLAISSQFQMRYRGLFEYYGKDFIAYKREKPSDKNRNEFLRVMSMYMANYLEDDCPPSWKLCQASFWEDFIYSFYPDHIKFSPNQKSVENFLDQLKKFVRWLDKRSGTSWYSTVEPYTSEAFPDLKICEKVLYRLVLHHFPRIHHADWNFQKDVERINQEFIQCTEEVESRFKVTTIIGTTVVVSELKTNCTYYVKDLPSDLLAPGFTLSGVIGKKSGEQTWNWYITVGIHPPKGRKLDYAISIKQESIDTNDGVHFLKK